jgi:hypothetical protein
MSDAMRQVTQRSEPPVVVLCASRGLPTTRFNYHHHHHSEG